MIDWNLPPDLQKKYNEVVALTRILQKELGVEPRTLEQRHQDFLKRKEEEQRRAAELEKIKALTGTRRPPPKWKV